MDRIATFLKYIIWIVLFLIFSEVLINVNLNKNNYNPNIKYYETKLVDDIKNKGMIFNGKSIF